MLEHAAVAVSLTSPKLPPLHTTGHDTTTAAVSMRQFIFSTASYDATAICKPHIKSNHTCQLAKKSMRWIEFIRSGAILTPYVANIAMNLWGHDLLQQWNTRINISPILETNHKLTYVSWKNIR
ncbi:hypothetical protein U0070_023725, partial [Myodes glareolus]